MRKTVPKIKTVCDLRTPYGFLLSNACFTVFACPGALRVLPECKMRTAFEGHWLAAIRTKNESRYRLAVMRDRSIHLICRYAKFIRDDGYRVKRAARLIQLPIFFTEPNELWVLRRENQSQAL